MKIIVIKKLVLGLFSLFLTSTLFAQTDINPSNLLPIETAKLTATETTSYFGNSISFSANGNVLAIGEYGYSTPTRTSSGRVKVYTNETGEWLQKGQDLLGIEDSFNEFGKKVQLSSDGNTLAVYDSQIAIQLNAGETLEDKYGSLAPEFFPYIQIYQFTNNTWVKIGNDFLFNAIDEYSDMSFSGDGTALAISKKYGIEVYELNGGSWSQTGQTIISRDSTYDDKISVSEDGSVIIVGDSYYSDPNSADQFSYEGQVKVYQNRSGSWSQLGNTIIGTNYLEYFGDKVDISNDAQTIAIASSQVNGDDSIQVYNLINNNWVKKGSTINQSDTGDILSLQLSNNGNHIVVGELYNARMLKYTSDWEQVNLTVTGDDDTDEFGYAIAIAGDASLFAVGAPSISTTNRNGYVSFFEENKNSINQFGDDVYGTGSYDVLGSSVSVSGNGNIIAVGSRGSYNSGGVWKVGNVKVYEKTNNGLQQIGSDIRNITDFDSGEFGSEVRLNQEGNILAVSAPYLFTDYGGVYIYKRLGNNWEPLGNVIVGNKDTYSGSGLAISEDGYTVAIGAPERGGAVSFNSYRGETAVYQYNIQNSKWEILGERIIGEGTSDYSGASVSLSGDGQILAIGAIGNDGETSSGNHGHVRVFKWSNNSWEQLGDDIDGDTNFNLNFGKVVKLSSDGKMLVIADTFSESQAGSIEIYNWNHSTNQWKHETQLKTYFGTGANNSHRYNFGEDISISKDKRVIVVGEYNFQSRGKIHIYTQSESGTWESNALFLKGTHNNNQYFGGNHSISDNGNTLVIGSSGHNEKGTNSGMMAVYHLNLCSSLENFEVFNGVNLITYPPSDNLIINGNAEILPLEENGWSIVSGTWNWPERRTQSNPVEFGHAYFRSSVSGEAEIYQDLDVSDDSGAIDTGNQYFYFSVFMSSFALNTAKDEAQVIVEFRNANGDVLGTYDTGLSDAEEWTKFETNSRAPINTRTIRVRLIAYANNSFSFPRAFLDNVVLRKSIGPNAVYIPDANFEQYLIDENIDSDATINGSVLKTDIENIENININDKNISDLTGIQEFKRLKSLSANNNQISSLNILDNLDLEELYIANNQLTTIDVSKNIKLKKLDVGENNLTNLDVHFLSDLESLSCYKNQLTAINLYSNKKLVSFIANENQLKQVDVRQNTNLFWIDVDDNNLESLVVKNGNNTMISVFSVTDNINLTCIEVDDASYSNANWPNKDSTAFYSTDCAPANDDCADAIPLVVGQQVLGDVNSGTANNNPSCAVGTVLTDVWYSVIVPATGEFSVQGTPGEGVLKFAIYASCTSISPIACGTSISLNNLTVGTKFYLKIWIESASSRGTSSKLEAGTFTLKAEDSSVLSTNDFSKIKNELIVYPNPTSSSFSIKLKDNTVIDSIQIFNSIGSKVLEDKNLKQEQNIDISKLVRGIYLLKVNMKNQILLKKLIVK